MSNLDDFNRGVALVLARLYEAFPQKLVLSVPDLDPAADENTQRNFAGTIEFLAEEGFIRTGSRVANGFLVANATLTTKGLAILSSVPDSIRPQETLGDRVKAVAKVGGKEALSALIGQIIGTAAAAYTKSMHGG